jgi:hypothetical protein
MNDIQQNKLGMFEKVNNYLTDNAAVLASVTQIAPICNRSLSKLISSITDAAGVSGSDTTGFTIQKATERTDLEAIALKVSRAAAAYFLSIGAARQYQTGRLHQERARQRARQRPVCRSQVSAQDSAAGSRPTSAAFNSGPDDVDRPVRCAPGFF